MNDKATNTPGGDPVGVRDALRTAVTRSMKARERDATATYRAALAAIENAEAVPVETLPRAGAVEGSAVGLSAADAARRELSEEDMREIVRAEVGGLRAAAGELRHPPTTCLEPAGARRQAPRGSDTAAPEGATDSQAADPRTRRAHTLDAGADLLENLLAGLHAGR